MTSNVDHTIEIPDVYDGYSIIVLTDPYRYVNRWAEPDDPTRPRVGYERRFQRTEEFITASGVPRGSREDVVWGTQ